jgi:hypothetical protein
MWEGWEMKVCNQGAVALTGLNRNDIVGTLQCQIFKRPADATEPFGSGFVQSLFSSFRA